MPVFQVSSRIVPSIGPVKKKQRHSYQRLFAVIRFIGSVSGAGGLFGLSLVVFRDKSDTIFILLPVLVYLAVTQFRRYNLKLPVFMFTLLLNSTPIYLLMTIGLAFLYYGAITELVLFMHQSPGLNHIIIITTTLTQTIIFDPALVYFQNYIERRFNRRNRETIRAIEDFTATLREEIDLDQLRERFLTLIQQTMRVSSISLWTHGSHKHQEIGVTEEIVVADSDPLIAYILHHSTLLELDRLNLDSPILQDLKLHAAEILLPLLSQGELIGLLILGPRLGGEVYTPEEYTTLATLAPQVAPALRVARLVQEQKAQVRERERLEQELRTAQDIQHSLLPKNVPHLLAWQIVPYYRPAREVGGDFYDFLVFANGQLGLLIGDVTDKGIPAALVMATTHTMLRTVAREHVSPGEVLARVNELLYAEIPSKMFVTCFYAVLDPESGRMIYANAGQELPYLRQDSGVSELQATGMPLGMMPGTCYEEHEVTLAPGESVLFYSDGLVEAHNPKRDMFDYPRLSALIGVHSDGPTLISFLLSELATFTGSDWEQEDDVTMVTLQRMYDQNSL